MWQATSRTGTDPESAYPRYVRAVFGAHVPFVIGHRPCRKDRQGLIHVGYSWGETFWEPMCEVYTVQARRDTDEPEGAVPTCLLCWNMVLNKGG